MDGRSDPLGAVLAGGAAVRLGGSKAGVELAGRPLISYPLAAFAAAGIEVMIVAKPDTALPPLDVPVLTEPAEPRHPLLGAVTALEHAAGQPIVTCPCDTPFVTAALLSSLASAPTAAIIRSGDMLHPLLARFRPEDLDELRNGLDASASATATAQRLSPVLIEADPETTFNVNTPDDLAQAASRL